MQVKVVFRTDASPRIGTGHLVRCRTLALALLERGASVEFVSREHVHGFMDSLSLDPIPVALLPAPEHTANDENYAAWLGASQQIDAEQTIETLRNGRPDWIVADHYAIDAEWERLLKPHCGGVLAIDDLANRAHECDILLDQNYFSNAKTRYAGLVPEGCELLLGPEFALIRPEYGALCRRPAPRTAIKRVLVFFGGADFANLTGLTLEALSQPAFNDWTVDVVAPPSHPHRAGLLEMASRRKRVEVHGSLPHLAHLMARADIAIGAGGTTTWERLCAGLPSLVISVAGNQVEICSELQEKELIRYLGAAVNVSAEAIADELQRMRDDLPALEERRLVGQRLVDGYGVKRVAEALFPSDASALRIKAAAERDLFLYFDWANDAEVRRHSLKQEPITLPGHTEWFLRRLSDAKTMLFVLEANGLPAGQTRFQRDGDEMKIAYSLDARFRGRSWGGELVRLGLQEALHRFRCEAGSRRPIRFTALVKEDNSASVAIFRKLGFAEEFDEAERLYVFKLACP